jgi:hypothetical protein
MAALRLGRVVLTNCKNVHTIVWKVFAFIGSAAILNAIPVIVAGFSFVSMRFDISDIQ